MNERAWRPTPLGYVVGLAAIWVLLWGTASPANVLGGLAVGAFLVAVVPGLRRRRPGLVVRPLPLARLVRYMLANAVRSNVTLIREIVSPGSQLRTGIVEVRLPDCSDELLTIITSLLGLTPGTMPVELHAIPDDEGSDDAPLMVVHVLHLDSVERVRCEIEYLAALAINAFGSTESVAALPVEWSGTSS